METPITPDEIMVTCIAHQLEDGETVAQGIATPLVAAGFMLARLTHAPHIYFTSAIGQSMSRESAPLSISKVEGYWLDRSLRSIGFVRAALEILPSIQPKEFFRPAQIDSYGNFNNLAFGKDYLKGGACRLRLPGSGGIPDVTTFIDDIYLYVPRHSRVTFVSELDIRSGLGFDPARTHGSGPRYLVSDLGQFDFSHGRMRLISYHPGSSIQQIQSKTGFPLDIAENACQTPLPSHQELDLLRHHIDPHGIRRLELLSGAPRRQLLLDILEREQ